MSRIVGLAWRGHRQAPARFVLLVTLIVVGILIFLTVSSLSRASTDRLDAAIESDVGATGTYRIHLSRSLGLDGPELTRRIGAAVGPMALRPLQVMERFSPQRASCPPFEELGQATLTILRDSTYAPRPLPFGQNLPDGTAFCLAGLDVPAQALYLPAGGDRRLWGESTLFVTALYADQVAHVDARPIEYEFIVTTGRVEAQDDQITSLVAASLDPEMQRMAFHARDVVSVLRVDSAPEVRAASDAVQLVYGIIAWGVLLLGGLGILVAQLIMVRDRTWFFGLARAVGASPRTIAVLVAVDATLVVLAGAALSILLAIALAPVISAFGQASFQVQLTLLDAAVLPQLVLGVVLTILLGAAWPAWRATRLDPLDILERR